MKKRISFLMFLIMGIAQFSLAQINFEHGTLAEVLQKAKESNKLIFIDAYTEWCGPCKRMSAATFTDPEVGKYFNEHFINYKLDMEKGEGLEFARTYRVNQYPTFLFLKPDASLHDRLIGYMQPQEFLQATTPVLANYKPAPTPVKAKPADPAKPAQPAKPAKKKKGWKFWK
jgi:thioredoxin-related protein